MDKNLNESETHKVSTNCGNMYITIVRGKDGRVNKILHHLGKSGTCAMCHLSSMTEVLTSLFSHCSYNQRYLIMSKARGHRCGGNNDACVDVLIRTIMDVDKLDEERE